MTRPAGFVGRFALFAGLFLAAYAFPYAELGISERWFQGYLAAYARLAGGVLSLLGEGVRVTGTLIEGRYPLRIVKTCDAMEANLLFLAAVLAFPVPPGGWKKKLAAIAIGLTILVATNVARICTLYFIGVHAPSAFELFHAELWPLLLIAIAVAAFVAYTAWLRRQPAPVPAP